MATIETNPQLGAQVQADAKEYVLHSWSVQNAINPIPVAGAEGRYFWDYEGKRYLDFASQLVNVSIGHGHPKLIAAIKEQAEKLCTIGPPMATEPRSQLGPAARGGDAGRPEDVVLHERRRRGERERDQGRALVHGPAQGRSRATAPITGRRPARSRLPGTRGAGTPSQVSPASCGCSTPTRTAALRAIPIPAPSARAGRTSRRSSSTRARTPSRPSSSRRSSARTASSSRRTATCSRSARPATGTGSC